MSPEINVKKVIAELSNWLELMGWELSEGSTSSSRSVCHHPLPETHQGQAGHSKRSSQSLLMDKVAPSPVQPGLGHLQSSESLIETELVSSFSKGWAQHCRSGQPQIKDENPHGPCWGADRFYSCLDTPSPGSFPCPWCWNL